MKGADDKFRRSLDFAKGEVHLTGTDQLGRDVFVRILYGTRISLTIGLVAVSIYATIGTILGAFAGYFGRWVDMVIMRVVEVVLCVPALFLILTILALFDTRSIFVIMVAIGLVSWTGITRLVRGEFLRERNIEYVAAAKVMGFPERRIVFQHVLPNALAPVLVAVPFGVASAILIESTLMFLGLGDPTVPSWGRILNDGREHGYWHLILPPAVAIFVTVTALNLVGDGLRDALDPKLRD
jgi:peptide/nickel transport system permease protein